MKRIIGYHMAAILGASMLASPALAQGGSGQIGSDIAPVPGVQANADRATGGPATGPATMDAQPGAGTTAEFESDFEPQGTAGLESDFEDTVGMERPVEGTAEAAPPGTADITTGAIGSGYTQQDALTAIRANAESAAALGAMTQVDDVEIVPVAEIEGYDDMQIEQALGETPGALDELQVSVETNPELASELEARNVAPNSVIAANTAPDGQLTVFVR